MPGDSTLLWTGEPGHATALARQAARDADVVCAVGGDGTVSEVVNGLMPDPVPIVVVPTGSGNDFASLVPSPRTGPELAAVLADGVGHRLDVIDCGDRYCANSVGIGFEALVTANSLNIRHLRGLPLYLLAVLKALAAYESNHFTLTLDDRIVEGDFLLVSAANGPRAGGGFYLNPAASATDGMIDVCVADRMSRARMLSILPLTLRGAHVGRPGIRIFRAARVEVAAATPYPIHVDGEYLGRRAKPLSMSVLPRVLAVLCRKDGGRGAAPPEKIL